MNKYCVGIVYKNNSINTLASVCVYAQDEQEAIIKAKDDVIKNNNDANIEFDETENPFFPQVTKID